MQILINGSEPFKCLKDTFAVAATSAGYTLNYSVDRVHWTAYSSATPANENLIVNGVTPYMWFKLEGATDEEIRIIL